MRRPKRLGISVAVLLVILFGAYSAVWFVVAARMVDGITQWAQSLHAQNLDVSWDSIRVRGFPFSFRVEISDAQLRSVAGAPRSELTTPLLTGSARPWNFRLWRVTAPRGLKGAVGPAAPAATTLTAATAEGSIALEENGAAAIWLDVGQPVANAFIRLAADDAQLWLNLPPQSADASHSEPSLGIAFDLRQLRLPAVPAPFGNPLDELAFAVTMRGRPPEAPLRQAAAAWRDAGGTVDLDRLSLRWDTLAITGSGTLALDNDLQPMGSFSGVIEGYQQLMKALVAAGRIRAGDARIVGLALGAMAKTGPDGRPELSVPFTIQDGQMYLGPAKLGPAPRINWE